MLTIVLLVGALLAVLALCARDRISDHTAAAAITFLVVLAHLAIPGH